MRSREFRTSGCVDLRLTMRPLRHGFGDPTVRIPTSRDAWRATRTPDGPATEHLEVDGDRVRVTAWGPGAGWLLEGAPDLVGARDDPRSFAPVHPRLRHLHRRLSGLRIGRSAAVVETLIPTILEQKVTGYAARESYRKLVYRFGEPAPGPAKLWLQPSPETIARLPYHEFHPLGVERKRANVLRNACAYAARLEETTSMGVADATRRLRALPGIGAWTAAIVAGVALGDPDAVEVGDFHLPDTVCWVLAREPRGSDDRMLELLEPYRGQRGRAVRLIEAGDDRPPRFGPRMRIARIERI